MSDNPRQLALRTLRAVQQGAFADVALDRTLRQANLIDADRRLLTELVYGCVRRQRSLDALVDQFAKKPARQQPPDLRLIFHLGLYQLRYLNHIPAAAAVNTTVDLARQSGLSGLSGFVNGLLRQYLRHSEKSDPLQLPTDPVQRLGILHSYPDWIIEVWRSQIGLAATEQLCLWLNQPPAIDLRINPLQSSLAEVEAQLQTIGVQSQRLVGLPQALRLTTPAGAIHQLPGFDSGGWTTQDSSAQLVSHLLHPQPGNTVLDLCAAPGGKTTHTAELMADQGKIWACDRTASRLRKLKANLQRLKLQSVNLWTGDSRQLPESMIPGDRVLLDAPCSGLGTLHRHADARWRQTPETVTQLAQLQTELLEQAAHYLKPGGLLVYATCTLHPSENEAVIEQFLARHPQWQVVPPTPDSVTPPETYELATKLTTPEGWLKVWPQEQGMDGFFIARLQQK